MSRYIVFDVETPNCLNNRMSAIGVAVVENGAVTAEYYSLVNPEAGFDSFNVRLTGITPEMVKNQPVFPALWGQIKPLFESGVLVAHYAPFDMGVLDKCLRAYGVGWQPSPARWGAPPIRDCRTISSARCARIWASNSAITTPAATAAPPRCF
ncbi:MAG: exonuclease domain-containing protein [Bacillota bacterium]